MDNKQLQNFLHEMPKVELHIHLEGAIPVHALWELVIKYNGTNEVESIDKLKKKFEYTDFPHFIETWVWKNRFLNEYDDFTFIAEEVSLNLHRQNIRYAEMFFSPPDFMHRGLNPKKITEAVYKGTSKHKDKITINLIADLVRDYGPEKAMQTLRIMNEVKNLNVIGIGIGGSEHAFPPGQFREVFDAARNFGFRTSAHAGEASGAESIWSAAKDLKAERIGHGTRAFEDPELVEYLRVNQIPLEMCPISNLRTGVVSSLGQHPLKEFFDKGLNVFVNTDDPEMFNNTMAEEYEGCINEMGFSMDEICTLAVNAIDSAWCEAGIKQLLNKELNNFFKNNIKQQ